MTDILDVINIIDFKQTYKGMELFDSYLLLYILHWIHKADCPKYMKH